ncbi:MAG: hypothetical protein M3123_05695 [Actinomycetota bacterium]|nr:hypothetical protein [Actinomycetota bacterium]
MTAGRVVLLVVGSIAALIALALLVAGGVLLWAHLTQRDEGGFFTTSAQTFETRSYAVTSEEVDLGADPSESDWIAGIATVRLAAEPEDAGRELFVGIARERDVEAYLGGVAHDEVVDVDYDPFRVDYRREGGGRQPAAPTEQDFWVAEATGGGEQELEWEIEEGRWTIVMMNADGSRGVAADVSVGAKVDFLLWVAIGLLVGGVVVGAASAAAIVFGARTRRTTTQP